MLKNKKVILITLIVLIIFLVAFFVYFFFFRGKQSDDILTPKDRADVLKELIPKSTTPIPQAQRAKILKGLVPEKLKIETTSTKRSDILNSFNKQ